MKETINVIRDLLVKETYRNEQHVRFSLVARICYELGWDIWNPNVFYTEQKVVKLTSPHDKKIYKGKVDIALRKYAGKEKYIRHIFIETKAVGKMQPNNDDIRRQLEAYSLKYSVPLSILTDGQIWEFYLNSMAPDDCDGDYRGRMICSIDLIHDDIEDICTIFTDLLSASLTAPAATTRAKRLSKNYLILQYIKTATLEVIDTVSESLLAHEVLKVIKRRRDIINFSKSDFETIWKKYSDTLLPVMKDVSKQKKPTQNISDKKSLSSKSQLSLTLKYKDLTAQCVYNFDNKKYTLLKDSEISLRYKKTLAVKHQRSRDNLIKAGDMVLDTTNDKYILKKSIEFDSPSGASCFVVGASSDGYFLWKDKKESVLDSYRSIMGKKKSMKVKHK